ncbi:MAG: ABC transporter permease [Oscillospiraceae bacterium]|nr:ABC transporter permease [Erysipelotrichaceae bacterium]MBQ4457457.1 ABC transporter permease [Clostridia bacterium]MBR0341954.1 ABC transporter permease [Oscillospiraceae bacterium]
MKEKIQRFINSELFENLLPVLILIMMTLLFAILTGGRFMSATNIKLIINQATVIALIATGAVFVYSSGKMNIAMGSTTCVTVMIGILIYARTESLPMTFVGSIIASIGIMACVVFLSNLLHLDMQALTTMLMVFMQSIQSIVLVKGSWAIPYSTVIPLQKANIPMIMLFAYFIIAMFLYDFTPIGRNLEYIGENRTCAQLTGIKLNKYVALSYLFCSVGIGLGAGAFIIRNASIGPSSGSSLNMDVILAMVLAGSPLKGGSKSKIYSGIIGALISVGLGNGLTMLGIGSYYIQIIKGILFLVILISTSKRPDSLPVKQML